MPDQFIPTGVITGVSGSITAAPVTVSMLTTASSVIPVGMYIFYAAGADVTVQVQEDATPTWTNVTAGGVGGLIVSDGVNMRFHNAGGGTETVKIIKIG